MKKPISEATATELAKFANIHHGIDVPHTKGKENIIALLRSVNFTGDEIEVDEPYRGTSSEGLLDPAVKAAAAASMPAQTVKASRNGKPRRMVKITIAEQDIPNSTEGTEPVKASVNGSCMYVPRGKPVEIPYEYYDVLVNAKVRQYSPAPDEYTPLGESRDVPRFPITVHHIDPAPEAEAVAA